MGNPLNLTGQIFGRLTVGDRHPVKNKQGGYRWNCKCICGNLVIVTGSLLKFGNSKSCGCILKENTIKRNIANAIHGMTDSIEYSSWGSMKDRCNTITNKDYVNYGGRGIKICEEWNNSFENFYRDMGPRPNKKHSIERINVNGNYEPSNCKWATSKEQSNNRRTNRRISYKDETLTLKQLSEKYNVPYTVLKSRMALKWSIERAITTNVENREMWNKKLHVYKGETKTLKEWAKIAGKKTSLLRDRMLAGYDIETAMIQPVKHFEYKLQLPVTYKGVTRTLAYFSKIYNIPSSLILTRIRNKWSIEKIFETPIKYINNKYFTYAI